MNMGYPVPTLSPSIYSRRKPLGINSVQVFMEWIPFVVTQSTQNTEENKALACGGLTLFISQLF